MPVPRQSLPATDLHPRRDWGPRQVGNRWSPMPSALYRARGKARPPHRDPIAPDAALSHSASGSDDRWSWPAGNHQQSRVGVHLPCPRKYLLDPHWLNRGAQPACPEAEPYPLAVATSTAHPRCLTLSNPPSQWCQPTPTASTQPPNPHPTPLPERPPAQRTGCMAKLQK